MNVAIVIPVLNDWASLRLLTPQIADALAACHCRATVIAVDDGSTEPCGKPPELPLDNFELQIVRLGSNLGHQRAIVVGLAHVRKHLTVDAVIVMDADGEDRPADLATLLAAADQHSDAIISARRARRSESLAFRTGYLVYKCLHRALTGKRVQGGNYSLIPASRLDDLLHCAAIWQHYAAGILSSRLPVVPVDTARGQRLNGQSRMNFVGLIVHGITAISVFDRIAFVRLLLACLIGMTGSALGIITAIVLRLFTDLAIPGWATYTTGLLGVLFLQLSTISVLLVGILLQRRNTAPFIPAVDALSHVVNTMTWTAQPPTQGPSLDADH